MSMRKYCFLVALILLSISSYGQSKPVSFIMPSANAASLGVYGEIPVSYFTGTPNISIPLYEIQGSKLRMPISLSYHAGGVRPDQHPGWTGIGWTLMAGGAITRKMNKMPDELNAASFPNMGYYFNYNALNNSNWASNLSTYGTYAIGYDVEPDEFSFNFMGYSGKFFLDQTRQWRVQCDKSLKVIFNSTDFFLPFVYNTTYAQNSYNFITPTFSKFTIIDEAGNKYTFGGVESAIEYSDEMTPMPGRSGELFFPSSWYLTKIESADGTEAIDLNYVRGPFTSYIYKGYNDSYLNASHNGFLNPGCYSFSAIVKTGGRIISPVYLESISMPKQSLQIDFTGSKSNDMKYTSTQYQNVILDNYGGATINDFALLMHTNDIHFDDPSDAWTALYVDRFIWRKLDAITIKNSSTQELVKKVKLNYTEQSTRRLRLNSLDIKDKLENTIQTYSCSYNDVPLLPNYLVYIGDHWGYNNNSFLPSSISGTNFYTLREPSEYYTKAELLTELFYPTGGSTEFQFEQNKYTSIVSADRQSLIPENGDAGGLRIKKIINKDGTGAQSEKEFYYVKNYTAGAIVANLTGSGILDAKPKYSFVNLSGVTSSGQSFTYSINSSNPVIPVSQNSSGTHIAYTEVVEKNPDNGYSIMKFTNHDNGYKDDPPVATFNRNNVPYQPFSSRDFERGKLRFRYDYKSTGKLLREIELDYSRINETGKSARAVENSFMQVCQSASGATTSRSAYLMYYYPFALTRETVKNYTSDDNYTTFQLNEKTFVVDDYKNVTQETIMASSGDNIKVDRKYPYDFNNLSSGNPYAAMLQKNMVSDVVESRTYRRKGTTDYLTGAVLNKFSINGSGNVYRTEAYQYTPAAAVSASTLTPTTYTSALNFDAGYYQAATYTYDANGDMIKIQKPGDMPMTALYNYNGNIIAEIKNSDPASVRYSSFDDAHAQSFTYNAAQVVTDATAPMGTKCFHIQSQTVSASGLNAAKKYRLSYWYKQGSAISLTNSGTHSNFVTGPTRNGWTMYSFELTGTTVVNIIGAGYIDEIRLYPVDAQMSTYAHKPLVGLTGLSDVNSRIQQYEYDDFSRLLRIRDHEQRILKQYDYQYQPPLHGNAIWQNLNEFACKSCQGTAYYSGIRQQRQKDINPNSPTYNTYQWVDIGTNYTACPLPAWVELSSACLLNEYNEYYEYVQIEEKDMNPCSPTYNQIRYRTEYNPDGCPKPACYSYCTGEGYKCVWGNCEYGIMVVTSTYYEAGIWVCIYHYEYSDGSWSQDYQIYSGSPCY